jgi:hypothetical protein
MLKAMSFLLILSLILTFLISCMESSTGISQDQAVNVSGIWRGDYFTATKTDSGTFIVEIIQNEDILSGELVLKSSIRKESNHFFIKGTVSRNELIIELNKDKIPYQYEFMLHANLIDSLQFSGDFFYSPDNLNAIISCEKLKKGRSEVIDSVEVTNATVISMAFDGNYVWLSTANNDYLELNTTPNIVDTVVVYYETDKHWTSSTLTSDGTFLWGHLPLSVSNRTESHILKFNKEGAIVENYRIPHLTGGLAFDGNFLWSLNQSENRIHRFDDSGNLYENFYINLPDVIHLEYGSGDFWSLGWFFKKLFKIDKTGKAIAVYDLPEDSEFFDQGGIAFDGTYFWYARNYSPIPISRSRIYRLSLIKENSSPF